MRVFLLYIALGVFIWGVVDRQGMMANASAQTLNRLTPPMNYFDEFINRSSGFNKAKLQDCIYYHRKIAKVYTYQAAESYGMMGFCYERLGKRVQAVEFYKKAIDENPVYFWPHYNLGVMAYRQGDYAQAVTYFKQALAQEPMKTIYLLHHSKVYMDVKLSAPLLGYDIEKGVQLGYQQAYFGLMDALFKMKDFKQLLSVALGGVQQGLGDKVDCYYYAGAAAYHLDLFDQAVALFKEALDADANNADALLYMGLCLKAAGREDLAQGYMARAAQLHQQFGSFIERKQKLEVRFF